MTDVYARAAVDPVNLQGDSRLVADVIGDAVRRCVAAMLLKGADPRSLTVQAALEDGLDEYRVEVRGVAL